MPRRHGARTSITALIGLKQPNSLMKRSLIQSQIGRQREYGAFLPV